MFSLSQNDTPMREHFRKLQKSYYGLTFKYQYPKDLSTGSQDGHSFLAFFVLSYLIVCQCGWTLLEKD